MDLTCPELRNLSLSDSDYGSRETSHSDEGIQGLTIMHSYLDGKGNVGLCSAQPIKVTNSN